PAKLALELGGRIRHRAMIDDIGEADADAHAELGTDGLRSLLDGDVAVEQRDVGAFARELPRNRAADAARATDDDRRLPSKSKIHVEFPMPVEARRRRRTRTSAHACGVAAKRYR